jgi:hypothetical protein
VDLCGWGLAHLEGLRGAAERIAVAITVAWLTVAIAWLTIAIAWLTVAIAWLTVAITIAEITIAIANLGTSSVSRCFSAVVAAERQESKDEHLVRAA